LILFTSEIPQFAEEETYFTANSPYGHRMWISALLLSTAMACGGDAHRQFDFWIGTWHVRTPDGKIAGTNRITAIAGGCALLEEWSGASGYTGKSLNIFDAKRNVWHQTWVGSDGTLLVIEGRFENGAMRLGSKTDRITWTPRAEGGLRQVWEQADASGWKVVFDGVYLPVKENGGDVEKKR
jgi:hypothetical protein